MTCLNHKKHAFTLVEAVVVTALVVMVLVLVNNGLVGGRKAAHKGFSHLDRLSGINRILEYCKRSLRYATSIEIDGNPDGVKSFVITYVKHVSGSGADRQLATMEIKTKRQDDTTKVMINHNGRKNIFMLEGLDFSFQLQRNLATITLSYLKGHRPPVCLSLFAPFLESSSISPSMLAGSSPASFSNASNAANSATQPNGQGTVPLPQGSSSFDPFGGGSNQVAMSSSTINGPAVLPQSSDSSSVFGSSTANGRTPSQQSFGNGGSFSTSSSERNVKKYGSSNVKALGSQSSNNPSFEQSANNSSFGGSANNSSFGGTTNNTSLGGSAYNSSFGGSADNANVAGSNFTLKDKKNTFPGQYPAFSAGSANDRKLANSSGRDTRFSELDISSWNNTGKNINDDDLDKKVQKLPEVKDGPSLSSGVTLPRPPFSVSPDSQGQSVALDGVMNDGPDAKLDELFQ